MPAPPPASPAGCTGKRDHGGLLFIDLRDHHGLTQVVFPSGSAAFAEADALRVESVVTITGTVVRREGGTVNRSFPPARSSCEAEALTVQSAAAVLPFPVAGEAATSEELRLRYRYLDLRRDKIHRNMMLRAGVIAYLRRQMIAAGFTEFQTPILTASSPEGARDFLVPSRTHPGTFYALPQAPQQFKQLAMVAGFDRYFQIAPCFATRPAALIARPVSSTRLDFEMSFVTQEDVFTTLEPIIGGVFREFGGGHAVTEGAFPRNPV